MRKKRTVPWVRRRRRIYIIVTIIALLVTPPLIWRLNMKIELRREIAALQAAGIPITEAAYERWLAAFPQPRPIPEFAAVHSAYVAPRFEVIEHFRVFASNEIAPELFAIPFDRNLIQAMREVVDLNANMLSQLRAARMLVEGHCSSTTSATDPVVELCCAVACVRAEEGDGAVAAEALIDGLAYVKVSSAAHWPFFTELGHSEKHENRLLRALASAAARCTLPEAQLRVIQAMLATPNWAEQSRSLQIAQLSFQVRDFQNMPWPEDPLQALNRFVFGDVDQWLASYMYWEPRRIALVGKPAREQQAVLEAASDVIYGHRPIGPPMHLVVASAAIEVILYHQRNGALPGTLDQLGGDAARIVDFYSEKPLGYKPEGDAFVLYSVGDDLEDNGGSVREDVVFKVTLPGR